MLNFEKIKSYYLAGVWTSQMVDKAVSKGIITQQERDMIINDDLAF